MSKPTFPVLRTERLLLREIIASDQSDIFHGLSDPLVVRFYGVSFSTFEATKEQMNWFKALRKSKTGIWWAVCDKDLGKFYGACGFNNLQVKHQKAELGFWLLPEYWGRGIIPEAVSEVNEFAFKVLHLHRIEAFVETENENSRKVLEKMGFNYEGTMKDVEIKNQNFISLSVFALLNGLPS